MRKLEVFFDYICPYCLKGHKYLTELLPGYGDIEVIWRPCESHPRPDRYGMHSDLCIMGFMYARDTGADIEAYNEMMYAAALVDRINIEDPAELSRYAAKLLDRAGFYNALTSGKYDTAPQDANDYAFRQSGVWVVPAYRMDGKRLDSKEDIGVTKEMLAGFLG